MTALSFVQLRAWGMECWSFYECLGKLFLSTEEEGAKAQSSESDSSLSESGASKEFQRAIDKMIREAD